MLKQFLILSMKMHLMRCSYTSCSGRTELHSFIQDWLLLLNTKQNILHLHSNEI